MQLFRDNQLIYQQVKSQARLLLEQWVRLSFHLLFRRKALYDSCDLNQMSASLPRIPMPATRDRMPTTMTERGTLASHPRSVPELRTSGYSMEKEQ